MSNKQKSDIVIKYLSSAQDDEARECIQDIGDKQTNISGPYLSNFMHIIQDMKYLGILLSQVPLQIETWRIAKEICLPRQRL